MIVEGQQLVEELRAAGFKSLPDPRDSRYFLPSEAWVKTFARWFKGSLPKYAAQKYDCDDFAIRALDRANDALRVSGKANDCGHSFGYCDVTIGFKGGWFGWKTGGFRHGANIVRTRKRWWYFEPQEGRYLSFDEMDSSDIIARRNFAML